jgi:hypothetical protein
MARVVGYFVSESELNGSPLTFNEEVRKAVGPVFVKAVKFDIPCEQVRFVG